MVRFNITIGYKNTGTIKEGSWSVLASGHVSRVMDCRYNQNVSTTVSMESIILLTSFYSEPHLIPSTAMSI